MYGVHVVERLHKGMIGISPNSPQKYLSDLLLDVLILRVLNDDTRHCTSRIRKMDKLVWLLVVCHHPAMYLFQLL
jgi:hypothetical protein